MFKTLKNSRKTFMHGSRSALFTCSLNMNVCTLNALEQQKNFSFLMKMLDISIFLYDENILRFPFPFSLMHRKTRPKWKQ